MSVAIMVTAINKPKIHTAYGYSDNLILIDKSFRNMYKDLPYTYLIITDASYFKSVTGLKAMAHLGYVVDSKLGQFKVVYVPNYTGIFFNPTLVKKQIQQGLDALDSYIQGVYSKPTLQINGEYPSGNKDIYKTLSYLLDKPMLTIDIETTGLKVPNAKLVSIAFAWDQSNGVSFIVEDNKELLIDFFKSYKGKCIYHNITFDVYVLIYELFMGGISNTTGLLEGLKVMLTNWEDTKIITYLATNTCAGNKLGLKDLSQEFAGNYSVDVKDVTLLDEKVLLQYNLSDCLCTWYVYNKYYPILLKDNQEGIYKLLKDSVVDVIQMQLTGLPVNIHRVYEVKAILQDKLNQAKTIIYSNPIVNDFIVYLNTLWVDKTNNSFKVKRVTINDAKEKFNPSSSKQMQELLYNFIKLPVLDTTDSDQPATGGDTLKKLLNHTTNVDVISLLNGLISRMDVVKILQTFIPALENATLSKDDWHYLCGNFNIGGTVSGRLSSSTPNLQNIPSGSVYGKLIKSCFQAPKGWLFCGLDYSSLEDKISALTTKDENKLKVYLEGYDGHSLRAFSYFKEEMPDIINTVDSINSISKKYPKLRSLSKAPTFALLYQGTYNTLIKNCGFSKDVALSIEANYHSLYKQSSLWIENKLKEASKTGYITAAFGLRVRTPLLHQVILGNKVTPYEALAEGRTAGNALGQSWGLLNNRAASEFMQVVRTSKHCLDIKPTAHIHDAQYYLIKADINVVHYVNTHLVKAVNWQDLPEIYHPNVPLGGDVSIFYPSWETEIVIKNNATLKEIEDELKSTITHSVMVES